MKSFEPLSSFRLSVQSKAGNFASSVAWLCCVGASSAKPAFARSSLFEYLPGAALRTCSAEDLVVMKAFASRPKDWIDLEGILLRQQRVLDWNYIQAQLLPLIAAKEMPEIWTKLQISRRDTES